MSTSLLEIEGTWEEIAAHGPELAGRKVRLTVLTSDAEERHPDLEPEQRLSTAASLLKYAGTWVGGDLDECLQDVYANRTKAQF